MRRTAFKIWASRDNSRWGKMLQGVVRDTFWTQTLAALETPDDFMNLVRVG